jgi:hypothetical protein
MPHLTSIYNDAYRRTNMVMVRKTIFLPLAMTKYFMAVKKKTGLGMAEQIRAILQTHIDSNPL